MAGFKWDDYEEAPAAPAPSLAAGGDHFDWSQFQEAPHEVSRTESALRGAAQGASLGFEDELAGVGGAIGTKLGQASANPLEANNPELQAKMDAVSDQRGMGDLYRAARNDERAHNAAAEKANPYTYGGAGLVGAVSNPISAVGKGLQGAAKLGGLMGLGGSDSDLTEGDVKGAAVDTALGGAGGVGGALLGKAVPKVWGAAKNLGKKALTTLGPSMEAIDARLAGKAQPNAKSYPELAEDLGQTVNEDLKGQIKSKSAEAGEKLSAEADLPREYVTQTLDDAIKAQGKLVGPADKQVAAALGALKEDLAQYPEQLSQKDIKTLVQKMDDNINWDDQSQNKLNRTLEGIRKQFDNTLKFQNPEYKEAIKPVSDRMKVMDAIKRQFNLKNVPGKGLQPTDTTATKIQTSLRENKAVTQANLDKLKEFTGRDYSDLAKDYQLAKQFENTGAQGSRRTVLGGGVGKLVGTGVGAVAGGVLGGPAGAGGGALAGHMLGESLGNLTGATLDKYGGQVLGKMIDGYVKAGNTAVFGKFKGAIDQAAKRGPEALSVLGAMLSKDPEFRKQIGVGK